VDIDLERALPYDGESSSGKNSRIGGSAEPFVGKTSVIATARTRTKLSRFT
jgi:hypothetical protein